MPKTFKNLINCYLFTQGRSEVEGSCVAARIHNIYSLCFSFHSICVHSLYNKHCANKEIPSPLKPFGTARPSPLLLLCTEAIWVDDQKMNMSLHKCSALVCWYLHLDVLENNLLQSTHYSSEQNIGCH